MKINLMQLLLDIDAQTHRWQRGTDEKSYLLIDLEIISNKVREAIHLVHDECIEEYQKKNKELDNLLGDFEK